LKKEEGGEFPYPKGNGTGPGKAKANDDKKAQGEEKLSKVIIWGGKKRVERKEKGGGGPVLQWTEHEWIRYRRKKKKQKIRPQKVGGVIQTGVTNAGRPGREPGQSL